MNDNSNKWDKLKRRINILRKLNIIWILESGTAAIKRDVRSIRCQYCREWSLAEMVRDGKCPYCNRLI